MERLLASIAAVARGVPDGPHAAFAPYGIDAISISVKSSKVTFSAARFQRMPSTECSTVHESSSIFCFLENPPSSYHPVAKALTGLP